MKLDIIHGDSLFILKNIETNSIDSIIADPPYNLGKNYGNNHDLKSSTTPNIKTRGFNRKNDNGIY